jgi:hypothetical protein
LSKFISECGGSSLLYKVKHSLPYRKPVHNTSIHRILGIIFALSIHVCYGLPMARAMRPERDMNFWMWDGRTKINKFSY